MDSGPPAFPGVRLDAGWELDGLRWVDRGPEPAGVAGYASQFKPGWIDYFQNHVGGRPTDFYWSRFRSILGSRTNNICWYCERQCVASDESGGKAPTVDHFRPISKFPALAYDWSNWIFSCHRCNVDNKGDQWPEAGYVDPCAFHASGRPERYFDFDPVTGEILPRKDLSENARRMALDTINDLGLNKLDVRYYRLEWTRQFVNDLLSFPVPQQRTVIESLPANPGEFAGTTAIVVEQLRRDGHI